jgi:ABC-type Na+ efflux pump permease subunit
MKWPRLAESLSIYGIMIAALGAGLAAAYGRELEAGRSPNRLWWLRRLLILPLLAITTAAASDTFALNRTLSAFTAAMMALGGYDVLGLIEARWRRRLPVKAEARTDEPDDGPGGVLG